MFDLIIPVYNPSVNWETKLTGNLDEFIKLYPDVKKELNQIIIINDGSVKNFTGKSISFLTSCGYPVQIIDYKQNMGKGFALREGIKKSTGLYCIYTDADMPFGFQSIKLIMDELQNGTDIVAGCRNKKIYYSMAPFKRKLISKFLMWINRCILNLPFEDTQAGIKGFNADGKDLFLKTKTNRFLFDLEFILLASKVKHITLLGINVAPAQDIHFSNFKTKVLMQELLNLCKIIFKRKRYRDAEKNIV